MKKIKSLLFLMTSLVAFAVTVPVESTAQFKSKGVFVKDSILHQWDGVRWMRQAQSSLDSTTTTDGNYHTIRTINVATNEVGILTVGMIGINDSLTAGVTGEQIVRYAKVGGTLTLVANTVALTTTTDTDLSGATWDITTSSNQIIVRVKGRNTYTVRWEADIRRRRILKRY